MSFVEARTRNEITKSLIGQLRLREREGTLVDRAKAMDAVFALARQERDAWQSWPARIAATLAADLQVDPHALELALDKLVRAHLKSLAEVNVEGAIASARRVPRGAPS